MHNTLLVRQLKCVAANSKEKNNKFMTKNNCKIFSYSVNVRTISLREVYVPITRPRTPTIISTKLPKNKL